MREWQEGRYSDDEMRRRVANGPLSRRLDLHDPFQTGFAVRWQEFGARDAANGHIRAKQFRSHWYNMGWWNLMAERRRIGWRHASLDAAAEEMQTRYWDKIRTGRSDDYYSA
jgi:hypothetical protein